MKINAHFIVEGSKNNVQAKAHYRVLIWCIILGMPLRQLAFITNHLQLSNCGSPFGHSSTNTDEGYRILPPNQIPQTPVSNSYPAKTPAKREAIRS